MIATVAWTAVERPQSALVVMALLVTLKLMLVCYKLNEVYILLERIAVNVLIPDQKLTLAEIISRTWSVTVMIMVIHVSQSIMFQLVVGIHLKLRIWRELFWTRQRSTIQSIVGMWQV